MGGELTVPTPRAEGTLLMLRVPLCVPDDVSIPEFDSADAEAAAAAAEEAMQVARTPSPSPSSRLLTLPLAPVDTEVTLTSRMFECLLSNSDDVFALTHFEDPDDAGGEVRLVVDYISPSVAWRLAFAQDDVVGRDMLNVCHPEDRAAFLSVLLAARASAGGHLNYVHRNVSGNGQDVWCHTSGLCKGDQLFVVCRDMRTLASVELALRTFTLATSHDMREPCNTILMSAACLDRRPCVAENEEVADLVDAIRSACGLLLCVHALCITPPLLTGACYPLLPSQRNRGQRTHHAAGGGGPANGAAGRLQPCNGRRGRAASMPHWLRRSIVARRLAHHARSRARRCAAAARGGRSAPCGAGAATPLRLLLRLGRTLF